MEFLVAFSEGLEMAAYKWAVDSRHAAERLIWVEKLLKQNCWGSCDDGERMRQKGAPPFPPHF